MTNAELRYITGTDVDTMTVETEEYETVQDMGFQWCLDRNYPGEQTPYVYVQAITGEWLVYCRVEAWRKGICCGTRYSKVFTYELEEV